MSLHAVSFLPIAFLLEKDIPWRFGLLIVALPILAAWRLSDVVRDALRHRQDNPVASVTGVVLVGGFVTWLRHFLADKRFGATIAVVGILAVTVVGFTVPPSTASFWLIIGGTVLMPVGVVVASEFILPDKATRTADAGSRRWWWWIGGAALLLVGSLLITVWLDDSLPCVSIVLLFASVAGANLLLWNSSQVSTPSLTSSRLPSRVGPRSRWGWSS